MKKITFGLGALVLVLGSIGIANTALAYQGDLNIQGPNYSIERHIEMEKAFENKDYNAWKNLMQNRGRVSQVINKDNFAKFAEAYKLIKQGKTAEAQKIRQELGLRQHDGFVKKITGTRIQKTINQ